MSKKKICHRKFSLTGEKFCDFQKLTCFHNNTLYMRLHSSYMEKFIHAECIYFNQDFHQYSYIFPCYFNAHRTLFLLNRSYIRWIVLYLFFKLNAVFSHILKYTWLFFFYIFQVFKIHNQTDIKVCVLVPLLVDSSGFRLFFLIL